MNKDRTIEMTPPAPHGKPGERTGGFGDTARFLIILFVLALLLRSLIAAPFSIPSGSMLPRMMIGDYLFVAKWPYGYSRYSFPFAIVPIEGRILGGTPARGDVIVFRYPDGSDKDYVKRLIGLPGDLVQMKAGTLFLNGDPVPKVRIADYLMPVSPNSPCRTSPLSNAKRATVSGRQVCRIPRFRETLPGGRSYEVLDVGPSRGDDTGVYVVPEGHVFMMGDNRDDSEDSRFPVSEGGVGFLAEDRLIGRALVTFFSTDGSAEWLKPWTWLSAARWDRMGGTY
jgi:signal peptidase I